ncbi:hypothetical protein ACWDX6_02325 [Streptomyces sp. NPDC003027]
MGTVYLARSRGGRAVAVKVARPELAADPERVRGQQPRGQGERRIDQLDLVLDRYMPRSGG